MGVVHLDHLDLVVLLHQQPRHDVHHVLKIVGRKSGGSQTCVFGSGHRRRGDGDWRVTPETAARFRPLGC